MPTYFDHAAFEEHEAKYGHPGDELPFPVREAYVLAGLPAPARLPGRNLSIHTPPGPGFCCHCGAPVPAGQHRMAHAVAGFETARHWATGDLLRMLVDHCAEHWQGDHCRRDAVTPGSGWRAATHLPGTGLVGAGGWCEALEAAETLGMVLLPGAPQLARWALRAFRWTLVGLGVWVLKDGIFTSQGQQVANFAGPLTQLIVPGTATSGQGFNAGNLKIYTTPEPTGADRADKAETGTTLISWVLPATTFATPTSAVPSQAVMNAVSNVNAAASGTALYARLLTNASTGIPTPEDGTLSTTQRRFELSVGTSGQEIVMNTTAVSSGGACSLTSFSFTYGS